MRTLCAMVALAAWCRCGAAAWEAQAEESAPRDNFDLRPQGFRLFEVRDDFLYSYRFMEV